MKIPALAILVVANVLSISISIIIIHTLLRSQEQNPTPLQAQAQVPVRPKKFFAMHIGPSKTGTTSIQRHGETNAFEENTFGPDKDNIIYVGRWGSVMRGFDGWHNVHAGKEIRRAKATMANINKNMTVPVKSSDERNAYDEACHCMRSILDQYYQSFSRSANSSAKSAINEDMINKQLETDEDTRASLRQTFIDKCWIRRKNGKEIDFSYMLDFSLLDSNEAYSYKQTHGNNGKIFRIFDILGYENLIIVGAYRRYADWLVSAYIQNLVAHFLRPSPKKEDTKDLPSPGLKRFLNQHIDLRAPKEYRVCNWYDPVSVTLPESLEMGPSKLQARILNFFQLTHSSNVNDPQNSNKEMSHFKTFDSIFEELYCDALGKDFTPHTCNYAQHNEQNQDKDKDKPKQSSLVANKIDYSDTIYQRIVAHGYIAGFLRLPDEELKERQKNCKANWCDFLGRCIANNEKSCTKQTEERQQFLDNIGLDSNHDSSNTSNNNTATGAGTTSSNIRTLRDVSNYHRSVHKKTWTESLPIKCVGRELLEKLLEKSLKFEELVMPDFYASPLGKDEHIRLFWDVWLKKKKLFCTVDTVRLFQGATSWDEIINQRMVSHDWGEPIEWLNDD